VKILKMFLTGLLVAVVIVLGTSQYEMFKELDRYKVEFIRSSRQAAESQYMVEMLWQMLPDEISRQVEEALDEELGGSPKEGERRIENSQAI
jgi:hypothetical protein